jgi:transcriptional regulator with XRE-family HTH domain
MMLPIQLRMARAALGWTLKELGERAGVNMNTIARYEAGSEILTGTMQRLQDALRSEGVVFVDEEADFQPTIRIRKQLPSEPELRGDKSVVPLQRSRRRQRKLRTPKDRR